MSPGARWLAAGLAAAAIAASAALASGLSHAWRSAQPVKPDGCVLTALALSVHLDPHQAGNAMTIAATATREGLPAHAVTIAIATALQESKLRNLSYGDRDSVGLFQQRPSQGWGTAEQIQDPRYASTKFFGALSRIRGWQTMPVAEAAQLVQHSADGSAYAQWETQARTLAVATTGQAAEGVACTYRRHAGDPAKLAARVGADYGPHALDRPAVSTARGWEIAGFLVVHATEYRVAQVSYLGRTWKPSSGRWVAGGTADGRVRFTTAAAPSPG
ncbi:MAG: hypothetical protein WCB04_07140 [Mycobacteriales bacterium]